MAFQGTLSLARLQKVANYRLDVFSISFGSVTVCILHIRKVDYTLKWKLIKSSCFGFLSEAVSVMSCQYLAPAQLSLWLGNAQTT